MNVHTKQYLQNHILVILRDQVEPLTVQTIHTEINEDFTEDEVKQALLELMAAKRVVKDETTQGFMISGDYPL